jgi:cytidine deaminase
MVREINLKLEEVENESMLAEPDRQLVKEAKRNTEFAYAPYSGFKVAAVARLKNGAIVSGTNQENASYPVGICAERTLLSAVSSLYPNEQIDTIAITYHNINGDSSQPVAPCGICRQTLLEYELRTNNPIRLLLAGNEGKIIIVEKASSLLPLGFSSDDMNR